MKIIGISQNIKVTYYNQLEDCLDQNLINLLSLCGFLPIPIPNNLIDKSNNHNLIRFLENIPFSGFLLSGGNDWGSF